jgi:hypothetical protein
VARAEQIENSSADLIVIARVFILVVNQVRDPLASPEQLVKKGNEQIFIRL